MEEFFSAGVYRCEIKKLKRHFLPRAAKFAAIKLCIMDYNLGESIMRNKTFTIVYWASTSLLMMLASVSNADTVINNYGTSNNQPQQASQPNQPNQQNQQNSENNSNFDPRVPPAGSYSTSNADGSSEQLYTTGQNQPYYVDNPNAQSSTTPTQVFVQPTMPTPSPTPTPTPTPLKR
jgi:hypothetical protein